MQLSKSRRVGCIARLAFEIGGNKADGSKSRLSGTSLNDMQSNADSIALAYRVIFVDTVAVVDPKLAAAVRDTIEPLQAGSRLATCAISMYAPTARSCLRPGIAALREWQEHPRRRRIVVAVERRYAALEARRRRRRDGDQSQEGGSKNRAPHYVSLATGSSLEFVRLGGRKAKPSDGYRDFEDLGVMWGDCSGSPQLPRAHSGPRDDVHPLPLMPAYWVRSGYCKGKVPLNVPLLTVLPLTRLFPCVTMAPLTRLPAFWFPSMVELPTQMVALAPLVATPLAALLDIIDRLTATVADPGPLIATIPLLPLLADWLSVTTTLTAPEPAAVLSALSP